ncbi:efflux transporter outer membrane subunit [Variovorax atrisoli]|uniref:efflux transporter outer membrane subunit n=1 Tax=Variovorax atrisoli TaxID=3394203 RepID=UPI001FC952BA|nr:efflux transporter outer membrane subunit [Variovorax paradoxus]
MPRTRPVYVACWMALLCAALTSGCALHGDRAERAVELPSVWRHAQVDDTTGPIDAQWWRSFGSTELDAVIARAQSQSNDLAAAVSRVRQGDARARIAGAALQPQVTASLGIGREGRLGSDATVAGSTYAAGFAATYELDLWGRSAALRDEALQGSRASTFDRDTVRLTVTADVAGSWLLALALRERAEIAARNLDNARRVLALVEARSRAGAVSPLDLAQQRGLVAAQQRAHAALRQQASDAETALALLLGTTAKAFELQGPRLDALQVPVIGVDAPSALLVRRPDIARAEARLAAADANVLAARAALLPTVSLSATVGTGESRFGRLFDNPLYGLAAGLAAPVFDGGRLAGNRQLAEAKREELLADYRAAIVGAFADAETALNGVSAIDAQAAAQAAELAEARRAAELSEARYRAGAETLLALLDAQRTLYAAQDLSVQLRMARLQARVSLYRAMGGGWQEPRCTGVAPAADEGHTECA